MTPDVRRSARLLGASLAVSWAGVHISGALGGVIVLRLTGDLRLVGLPFFVVALGSAAAAYPAGHLMDRFGRVPVLVSGHVLAALGFIVGAAGVARGSLAWFLAGFAVAALGAGTTYLTRLAAADLYPPERRGRGLALVVFGVSVGAVAGIPLLEAAERLGDAWGRPYYLVAWSFVPVLSLVAALLVALIHPDPRTVALAIQPASSETVAPGATRWRPVALAGLALVLAQAAMVSVMAIAGPTLDHHGYEARTIGFTLTLHILGMFAFSPLVGRFVDRRGRRPALWTSATILLLGMAGVARWPLEWFPLPLFLIGLGWSFAFIGATALVADAAGALQRGRVTGLVDLGAALSGALASVAGGWALGRGGLEAVALVGATLALGMGVLAFALGPRPTSA